VSGSRYGGIKDERSDQGTAYTDRQLVHLYNLLLRALPRSDFKMCILLTDPLGDLSVDDLRATRHYLFALARDAEYALRALETEMQKAEEVIADELERDS